MSTKSSQPRKQRKFLFNAPLHLRRKILSAHLSAELRKQYKRRALALRKGDEVQIMRGKHAGKKGKVAKLDTKDYKIYLEGITAKKTVGTEVQVPIHPSKLKIINLNLDDERRRKILLRKVKEVKVPEKKTEEKPKEKVSAEAKETKKEEKSEAEKSAGAKVLASTQKSKEVGSDTATGSAQKI